MVSASRCAALGAFLVAACLPDNPPADSDGTSGADTDSATDTETDGPPPVPESSVLGCPAGETCPMLFVSQALDDRVEIFAPLDPVNAYRGAINLDFKPGIVGDDLDEPFGIALSDDYLHIVAGHYPSRDVGTMVSIPRTFLGERDAPALVGVEEIVAAGAFQPPVVGTPFGELEPIFLVPRPVGGRLLIGTFNNNLLSTEEQWTQPGKLLVVDAADPTQFATVDLSTLTGDSCNAAAQVVLLGDDTRAAVACDGNEGVAFLELGELSAGTVADAAAGITGKYCDLIPMNARFVRYLAPAGDDRVIVGLGPGNQDIAMGTGELYALSSNCEYASPIQLGNAGESRPAQIIPRGDEWLVASASYLPGSPKRGIYVVTPDSGLCETPIAGFTWETAVPDHPNDPFALALASDGTHLAVGAGAWLTNSNVALTAYGTVLWATLQGTGCDTTATSVVDLTDGAPGHAPAANPADPFTVRQWPWVVVLHEVHG